MHETPEISPELRRRALFAAIGCTVSSIVGLGIGLPLLSIIMERDMGVSGTAIGLNTAMAFVSALVIMPLIPRLMARFPQARIMMVFAITSSLSMLCYGLVQDYYFWFIMRIINGAALAGLFAIGEIWINQFAGDKYRGRIIALYAVSLGSAFAVGPIMLQWTGTTSFLPFAMSSAIVALASTPLLAARGLPQLFSSPEKARFFSWFIRAPVIVLPALVCGATEVMNEGLIPVYALRIGYTPETAALMLSIFALGTILPAFPIGYLADYMDRIRLMVILCCLWLTLLVLVPYAQGSFLVFAVLVAGFGLTSTSVYMMGMILAGQRYAGAQLAAAGAALVFAYNAGGLVAPVAGGWLMDNALPDSDPDGLLYFFCLLSLPVLAALARRSQRAGPAEARTS